MNLGLGQTAWTQIFRELGVYMKPIKRLRDEFRYLDDVLARIQVRDNGGASSALSSWVLTGAVYGTNTSEDGKLFPRLSKDSVSTTIAVASNGVNVNTFAGAGTLHAASTAGFPTSGTVSVTTGSGVKTVTYTGVSGNDFTGCTCSSSGAMATGGAIVICTVNVYTAASASGLVATGTGAYGTTITLAASNSSGLSGSVALGTPSASETDDNHYLSVFADAIVIARAVFGGSQPEHGVMLADYVTAILAAQGSIATAIQTLTDAATKFLETRLSRTLTSSQADLINRATKNTDGVVTTDYSGILEDLRAAMVDETSPSAETVLKVILAAASAVFASTNDGAATVTGPSLAEFAFAGSITGVCTDDTFGSEKFRLSQRLTGSGDIITASDELQIDRAYASPDLGIASMTLKRSLTLASGSANDFGAMSNWTLTGLDSSNVDSNRKLYPKVITGLIDITKFIIQLYSASSLASSSLVAQSDEASASATGVTLSAQNGSGLTGTIAMGSAPTNAHSGTINCNGFSTKNASKNVADSFTIAISQTSAGDIQDLIRTLFRYALNSTTSGSQTIAEGLITAGTFVPYSVRDV